MKATINIITFCIMLCSTSIFGQHLSLDKKVYLELENQNESEYFQLADITGDRFILLGQQRKEGKLFARLTLTDLGGKVLKDTLFGAPNEYTRPTNIVVNDDFLWLGLSINSVKTAVVKMNHQLNTIQEIDLSKEKSTLQTISKKGGNIQLLFDHTANDREKYPVLAHYNLSTKEYRETHLKKKNSSVNFHLDSISSNGKLTAIEDLPEDQRNAYIEMEIETNQALLKISSSFAEHSMGFAVGGSENTDNFADYWWVNIDARGNIQNEFLKVLENDSGVDVISQVLPLPSGNIFFIGQHYSKPDNFNYDIRIIVTDQAGIELDDIFIDKKGGEIPIDAILAEEFILIASHTSDFIKEKQIPFYILLDEKGKELDWVKDEGEIWQVPLSLCKQNKQYYILGKYADDRTNRFFLQKIGIDFGQAKP